MEMKIDKGIAITPRGQAKWAWFFYKAKEGDSLLLNEKDEHSFRSRASIMGFKISRRQQIDEKTGAIKFRVWFLGKRKK